MKNRFIKQRLWLKERNYQFYYRHNTKCNCSVCKMMMKYIDVRFRIEGFISWLCSVRWITVEFYGSDYADFREYEIISTKRVRLPDQKGFAWPKTDYMHIKSVDITNG